jgi:hypothetical protein
MKWRLFLMHLSPVRTANRRRRGVPQVFINELTLYQNEGIEVTVSSQPDNSECIKLLAAKQVGCDHLMLQAGAYS